MKQRKKLRIFLSALLSLTLISGKLALPTAVTEATELEDCYHCGKTGEFHCDGCMMFFITFIYVQQYSNRIHQLNLFPHLGQYSKSSLVSYPQLKHFLYELPEKPF